MKKIVSLTLALLLVLSLFAGCSSKTSSDTSSDTSANNSSDASSDTAASESTGETRDDIVIALASEPTQLDPQYLSDTYSSLLVLNTHDPLFRRLPSGDIVPALAESYELSEDGLVVTLHLREGVKFQDGTEMTAEDVAFSLNRAIETAQSETYTESFKEARVVDTYTVELELLYPDVAVLPLLTQGNNCIVPKHVVEEVGEENYANNICGTGAYKLVDWQKGAKLILEANKDYWEGAPAIKHVEYRILTESTTSIVALETGSVDLVMNIGALDAQMVQSNDELGYAETTSTTTYYVAFNCQKAPLDNKLVRKALAMAVDKDSIILGAVDGAGMPAANIMPDGTSGAPAEADQPTIGYDPEGAVKLLEEAGYGAGELTVHLAVREGATKKAATILQDQWKAIGVNTVVDVMERSAMFNDMYNGNLEAYIVGDVALSMDASMQTATLDSATIPYTNSMFYSNPEYDEINAEQAREVNDPEHRIELVTELLNIEVEDAPRIPLYHPVSNIAYNKDLNITVSPTVEGYLVSGMSWN